MQYVVFLLGSFSIFWTIKGHGSKATNISARESLCGSARFITEHGQELDPIRGT